MKEAHSVHQFLIKEGEEPFFEVGIHKYAIKDGEPETWRNTKIRIECPQFKLEVSLPRKVMVQIMDLVYEVDCLNERERKRRDESKIEVINHGKPEDA